VLGGGGDPQASLAAWPDRCRQTSVLPTTRPPPPHTHTHTSSPAHDRGTSG
jgi:hypothetical protein